MYRCLHLCWLLLHKNALNNRLASICGVCPCVEGGLVVTSTTCVPSVNQSFCMCTYTYYGRMAVMQHFYCGHETLSSSRLCAVCVYLFREDVCDAATAPRARRIPLLRRLTSKALTAAFAKAFPLSSVLEHIRNNFNY